MYQALLIKPFLSATSRLNAVAVFYSPPYIEISVSKFSLEEVCFVLYPLHPITLLYV